MLNTFASLWNSIFSKEFLKPQNSKYHFGLWKSPALIYFHLLANALTSGSDVLFYETCHETLDKDLFSCSFFFFFLIHRLCFNSKAEVAESSVTRPSTHISLGNLLSFAGVCQGAHAQIWDRDSGTGSECDQHQESPQAALQRQFQAVGLLERQGRDIHFASGKVGRIKERKGINSGLLLTLQSTWLVSPHPPNLTLFQHGFLTCWR